MRYEWIHTQEKAFPVTLMCQVLQVSPSGYYAYIQRLTHPQPNKDLVLIESVKRIHQEMNQSYGSRRMSQQLQNEGYSVGREKARNLMKKAGVQVRMKKRFKTTTDSKHGYPIAPNLLNQEFEVDFPNTVWVGDITYLWTAEGWLYLAVVLDLFSRRIVGWAMEETMKSDLVESALKMAISRRNPGTGLIFHSDRGSQYASGSYQQLLKNHRMIPSMSGTGNCYDNAVCERFFRSLKYERTEYKLYRTRQHARRDVIQYIEWFYNTKRLHSTLGYKSPLLFELQQMHKAA